MATDNFIIAQKKPTSRRNWLVKIVAGEPLVSWTSSSDWEATSAYPVESVSLNGSIISSGWSWDSSTGIVAISAATHGDPRLAIVQARVVFGFSSHKGRLITSTGHQYVPRIIGLPRITKEIDYEFSSFTRLSAGALTLSNKDGFFDSKKDLAWDAGYVETMVSIDTDTGTMADADIETIGRWNVSSWSVSDVFMLMLETYNSLEGLKIATNVFSVDEYPRAKPSIIGSTKPVILGYGFDEPVYPVDIDSNIFLVADEGIPLVGNPEVKDSDGEPVEITNVNLTAGTFVYSGWDKTEALTASYKTANDNPADAIEYLLSNYGPASSEIFSPSAGHALEGSGFGANGSRTKWLRGYELGGVEHNSPSMALRYESPTELLTAIKNIAAQCYGVLSRNNSGQITLSRYEPPVSEGLTIIRDSDIFTWDEETTTTARVSKITATFRSNETLTLTDTEAFTRRGQIDYLSETISPDLWRREDVRRFLSRRLATQGTPENIVSLKISPRYMTLVPHQFIRIIYDRRDIDQPVEILSVKYSPGQPNMEITISLKLRGFASVGNIGHYTTSAVAFPTRLVSSSAAVWSSGWSAGQKTWAAENAAYWHMSAGDHIVAGDTDSYRKSIYI